MAGGYFGGGAGTAASPYLVEDADDLNSVRNNLSAHFRQTEHIDFALWGAWTPIGDFEGSYDGDDHVIANMEMNAAEAGIFATTDGASFANMLLFNIDVTGDSLVGSLAGDARNSTFTDVAVIASRVEGDEYVGGLIGRAISCSLDFIRVACDIHITDDTVSSSNYVGGIIGVCGLGSGDYLKRSYYKGTVTVASQWGASFVGGLVGYLSGFASSMVSECESYLFADGFEGWFVGGAFGGCYDRTKIQDCYSRSDIQAINPVTSESGGFVGGFIGEYFPEGDKPAGEYYDHLQRCYSASYVEGGSWNNKPPGGFAGSTHPVGIYTPDCYFDSTLHGSTTNMGGAEARTTAQMTWEHGATTYTGWDFATIWMADRSHRLNAGYPMFHRTVGIVEGEGKLSGLAKFVTVLLVGAVQVSTQLWADLVAFIETTILLSGTINVQTYLAILQKLLMWAKREGVYEPVEAYARHNGSYLQVTHVYKREDGTYRE